MVFDPIVLFFLLGLLAGLSKSDLKIPAAIYEALSIYLLLAIGLKGGVELSKYPLGQLVTSSAIVLAAGMLIPVIGYPVLRYLGKLSHYDAASIAAHYGSVSVVTYSVAVATLIERDWAHDGYMVVYLALLEMPALILGVVLARLGDAQQGDQPRGLAALRHIHWGRLAHEVFFGKSILLLIGGLIIGFIAGEKGYEPIAPVFKEAFKGLLALFLLEMGLVAASRIAAFRSYGAFLVGFAIVMPLVSAVIGIATARYLGFSQGNAALLATLYASASYIAAPAAMRIAVPQANPALSIGASLGVTFPFNLFVGIPIYMWMARTFIPG
ncbi:MAG: sodium-dependent bicarbonate transport family permease [Tepidimonas sp.]|uniref:sodium-dependent bicarbonate transport family permease n=1 Tax=Tepidimonas sp. TaxID=2002775 RepID=UPI00298EFDF5|nr:sodium-dependent bicarbonate transport family permease [Tepidimonas sp.]MCS6811721.1 sodium-dependent bicarbonate transport family permease [Tepidimonas sp.]MDW8336114.1 sodium-dependent bicarbonate transport family permease [Tepidimonas sp.]